MARGAAATEAVKLAAMLWCMIGSTAAMATAAAGPATDCSVEFNNLMPCINYVQGTDPAPSPSCCTAFKQVESSAPICLCELLQQLQNPSSGLGNVTRALDISTLCKVPADVSRCAALVGTPAPAPAKLPTPPPVVVAPPSTPPVVTPSLPPVSQAPTGAEVDCTTAFNNLSPCLTYVSSNGTQPPPAGCCTALSGVESSQPVCLCQLLAQVNDSSQFGVNATKALDLPTICQVKADLSKCPALLGSPVGSPVYSPVGSPLGALISPSVSPSALTPVSGGPSSPASGSATTSSAPESSTPTGGAASSRQSRPTPKAMLLLTAGALVGLNALFRHL